MSPAARAPAHLPCFGVLGAIARMKKMASKTPLQSERHLRYGASSPTATFYLDSTAGAADSAKPFQMSHAAMTS